MILHPGILALIVGAGAVLLMVLYAGVLGVQIMRGWDFASSAARQLQLERRTYLVSTLLNFACGFQAASVFLFVFTADEIHPLFVGAMCATGTLNANPVGWRLLAVKLALLFLASLWIVLNRIDQRAESYPLVRLKYALLLTLLPLVALDFVLLLRYFGGLQPEIITSCCGSLFSSGAGVAGEVAGWPLLPTVVVFWSVLALFLAAILAALRWRAGWLRLLLAAVAALLLPVSLAAVVTFIALYIYQLPTHHCPFDMLQAHYGFVGYPLYLGLFLAVFFGLLPGLGQLLRRVEGLAAPVAAAERRWLCWALAGGVLFAALAGWPMVFGKMILLRYV